MKIRRCTHLLLEPREQVSVDLAALLKGRADTAHQPCWMALAAHLQNAVQVDEQERAMLGSISAKRWSPVPSAQDQAGIVARLLAKGLLLADDAAHARVRVQDEALRDAHWWSLMAVAHAQSRWQGVDSVAYMREKGLDTAPGLRAALGPPPAAVHSLPGNYIGLPVQEGDGFDALLARRFTCRNFDTCRTVPLALLTQLLQRTVMAHAQVSVDEQTTFLKKNTPSGGGLHATETYLLVQRVDGLAPGFYHYHPVKHALLPLSSPAAEDLAAVAARMVSGQQWFADAAVLLVFAPRFERSFWKYRDHAKAYRALLLDVGHISQAVQTCATHAGMGSFVTAAINESDVDAALGLDGIRQGAVAICGLGWQAAVRETTEFNPPRTLHAPHQARN